LEKTNKGDARGKHKNKQKQANTHTHAHTDTPKHKHTKEKEKWVETTAHEWNKTEPALNRHKASKAMKKMSE
jgi:hypothetical protein